MTPRLRTVLPAVLALLAAFRASSPLEAQRGAGRPAPLIVVSADGFRWDYLDRGLTPNLARLAARGVRARALVPSFPTVTFPNHYTIVTGLRPGRHGVTANTMRDPATGAWFRISDSAAVGDARWWGGEPLWVTAERQGRLSASMFWPGSEAAIGGVRPTHWHRYDGRVPNFDRVTQVIDWLDLPEDARPSVITLYFSDTDDVGHRHGPDSPELADAVGAIDEAIGDLLERLDAIGMAGRVNIVVVSDHGMAVTDTGRVVVLDGFFDPAIAHFLNSGAFVALDARPGFEDSLSRSAARVPHARLFPRAGTPARWGYRDHPGIAAVVGVAEEGWTVTTRAQLQAEGARWSRGAHGYDNDLASMRGILVAAGPAFRRGAVVPALGNVHVYELLCRAAGLRPAPNDGSPDSVRSFFRSR